MLARFMHIGRLGLILMLTRGCVNSVPTPQPLLQPTLVPVPTQTATLDACRPVQWPDQELLPDEEALVQSAFKQTELSGQARTMVVLTGSNCEPQVGAINYHFSLDVSEQAERATLEQMAHTIQSLVFDLQQYPAFDVKINTLVITWKFAAYGCSWGYDYVSHDGERVWHPMQAERFVILLGLPLSDLCTNTEAIESSIPKPDVLNAPIYQCFEDSVFINQRLQARQDAIINTAFAEWELPISVKTTAIVDGTACFYKLDSLKYTLEVTVSDDMDTAFLLEQSSLLSSVLEQLSNNAQIATPSVGATISWRFLNQICDWHFHHYWQDDVLIVQIDSVAPSPCPQP
ncbi:hypothetical protein [Herpetosiphon llansteffanensis]|uniref:hypothetical protein n=1 Tax=Herpetosiphon llansteffanensis TaxID=2094568 RepID=UPI000D7C1EF0|nr:hypothetical protein [Herpetosiphon llansteffanensis]